MATVRFLIAGRVQGVGFRAGTRRQAELHALFGLARNLSDGRVEVIAQGPSPAIERLALWLERGPAHARVDSVQRSHITSGPVYTDFRID
jgi:acylphosphatase